MEFSENLNFWNIANRERQGNRQCVENIQEEPKLKLTSTNCGILMGFGLAHTLRRK